jgi:hypothetical protein
VYTSEEPNEIVFATQRKDRIDQVVADTSFSLLDLKAVDTKGQYFVSDLLLIGSPILSDVVGSKSVKVILIAAENHLSHIPAKIIPSNN